MEENDEHQAQVSEFDGDGNDIIDEPMSISENEENQSSPLYLELVERILELQNLWDEHKLPIGVQDRMLRILFGDLGGARVIKNSSKRSMARLLVQLPPTWEGDLGGIQIPACWDQLQTMLKDLGMVSSLRYRICKGSDVAKHPPKLIQPSNEDNFTGEVLKCTCEGGSLSSRLKRDCLE
ncbi:hypothetical protein GOP47_0000016 [Adiantum capillus-veneris]|uniref:Uncharacterized protein n=1 Tax=Adiantum capillus-veneris TaxID=13818 RepID=A0A9D4VEA8_ADICA|nr:hypothetical protein GOP47_0000016 [Adiantum capillus-veneris]